MWQQRNQGGGIGASSVGSGSILLAALIGFILGFFWQCDERTFDSEGLVPDLYSLLIPNSTP